MNTTTIIFARNIDETKLKRFTQTTDIDGIVTTIGSGGSEKAIEKATESGVYGFLINVILHMEKIRIEDGATAEIYYENERKFKNLIKGIKETATRFKL